MATDLTSRTLRAPDDQGVTFVELFFDLVFVFAVTEVTGLVAHHVTLGGVAQAALVFWMIWWAWTQFAWALNPADTNHAFIRIGTLVATGVTFLMAISVGEAFGDGGLRFIVPYVVVRLIGLGLYLWVASEQREQLTAVRVFGALSLLGLALALAGGFVAPALRGWVWLGVVALDVGAALVGGQREGWGLHAPHFTERHGLFVIIALGESLIAAGVAATTASMTAALVALGAVAVVCLLWWTYFGWLKDGLEHAMAHRTGTDQSRMARDVYSLLHFPLVAGIIGVAVGIEAMVAHPAEPLHGEALAAFVGGLVLFVGMAAAAWWRARRQVLGVRMLLLVALVAAFALTHDLAPGIVLGLVAVVLAVLVAVEGRGHSPQT